MRIPTKIPTLVGLLLFVLLVGGFIVGFEQVTRVTSLASPDTTPKNVEITNITDTSFTISWVTDSPATGAIVVSSQPTKPEVIFDERDLSVDKTGNGQSLGKYVTHSVTYRTAQTNTSYSVRLLSNGKTFLQSDLSPIVRTGTALIGANDRGPAYGSVVNGTGQSATGAIVYLTLEGSQKLSALVSKSGTWLIPLNLIRTADLSQYLPNQNRITEQLIVRLDSDQASAITDTLNDSPVPEIRLGKTYDFRQQQALNNSGGAEQATSNPIAMSKPAVLGDTTAQSGTVTLAKPAQDAILSTFMPLIEGTGVPGNLVTIVLGLTKPFGGTTTVGPDGIWRYTPSYSLAPGKQSVTITSNNRSGSPVAITHSFEILKSGSQVLGIATPSATLAPTLAATSSPTPTSTLSGQSIPQTGNLLPTILLILMSVTLMMGGGVLIFL